MGWLARSWTCERRKFDPIANMASWRLLEVVFTLDIHSRSKTSDCYAPVAVRHITRSRCWEHAGLLSKCNC
jgi:hypothetical protein